MPTTPPFEIRQVIESWTTALRAKDVERLMAHYLPEAVFFDVAPPLMILDPYEYRRSLEEWFRSFDGPIGYDVKDPVITVGGGVAFSTSLVHLTGQRTSSQQGVVSTAGEQTNVWMRATWGFSQRAGLWKIAHEHVSIPILMDGSSRAAVDLAP